MNRVESCLGGVRSSCSKKNYSMHYLGDGGSQTGESRSHFTDLYNL